jgi:hypothetical protein
MMEPMCSIIFFAAKEQTFPLNILVTPYTIQSLEKRTIIKRVAGTSLLAAATLCSINKGNQQQQLARKSLLQQPQRCSCGTPFRQLLFNQQRKPAAAAPWLQE